MSHHIHSINDFKPTPEKSLVLRLSTGSSFIPAYKARIRMVSFRMSSLLCLKLPEFRECRDFRICQYARVSGLPKNHLESYHTFICPPIVRVYVDELQFYSSFLGQHPRRKPRSRRPLPCVPVESFYRSWSPTPPQPLPVEGPYHLVRAILVFSFTYIWLPLLPEILSRRSVT